MKHLFLFCIIFCAPAAIAFGQVVNPTIIYQDTDIALHHTDVYYHPFAPPDSNDVRENLSNESERFRDSDGLCIFYDYMPITHGDTLSKWQPAGDTAPLGQYAVWQRLFTARDKPDGKHSDIIAGGLTGDSVIISGPRFSS